MLVAVLVLWATAAGAGRKRIVVLDFEGPKADKFHDDFVKLVKKSHTIVATKKWNGTAEQLDAGALSDTNIKKVARKLKVDGVVEGKVEKRRAQYIITLTLHNGSSGEAGKTVETKSNGPKFDTKAKTAIKQELITAIEELEANHGGSDDDDADGGDKHGTFSKRSDKGSDKVGDKVGSVEDDSAAKADPKSPFKKRPADKGAEGEPPTPTSQVKGQDEDALSKPRRRASSDQASSDDGDDKPKKRVARGDDEQASSAEVHVDQPASSTSLSPAERAIDATLGMSFTARRLTFDYSSRLAGAQIPPAYRQTLPVAGAYIDATVYPLAWSHKSGGGLLQGLGFEVLYDRVLRISSEKADNMGTLHTLDTSSSRYAIGVVYRYPLDKLAVGGRILYGGQSFQIAQTLPVTGESTDIPNVNYGFLTVGGFARYPLTDNITVDVDLAYLAVFSTGDGTFDIGQPMEYGKASTGGYELGAGVEYPVTKTVFIRGQVRVETIGMTFAGGQGTLANTRDSDPNTQDVNGARDTYFGGIVTAGYAY
jgi:hypothetical protein